MPGRVTLSDAVAQPSDAAAAGPAEAEADGEGAHERVAGPGGVEGGHAGRRDPGQLPGSTPQDDAALAKGDRQVDAESAPQLVDGGRLILDGAAEPTTADRHELRFVRDEPVGDAEQVRFDRRTGRRVQDRHGPAPSGGGETGSRRGLGDLELADDDGRPDPLDRRRRLVRRDVGIGAADDDDPVHPVGVDPDRGDARGRVDDGDVARGDPLGPEVGKDRRPFASSPTAATIVTAAPKRAAATAWLAPLPRIPGGSAFRRPSRRPRAGGRRRRRDRSSCCRRRRSAGRRCPERRRSCAVPADAVQAPAWNPGLGGDRARRVAPRRSGGHAPLDLHERRHFRIGGPGHAHGAARRSRCRSVPPSMPRRRARTRRGASAPRSGPAPRARRECPARSPRGAS